MACQEFGRFAEVSSTVLQRGPLTLSEQLIRTLICPGCRLIFRSPVSTCTLGHSTCYACATRLGKCGVCAAPLGSIRSYTVEAQLGLVEVECGIPLCTRRIKASKIYDHMAHCEFRMIQCHLPIMMAGKGGGSARIDCAAITPFGDYVHHLTTVHRVNRYELLELDGMYDFGYDASGEDFLGFHTAVSAFTIPIPVLWGTKSFLIHSELCSQEFTLWVSALFSEEEASGFTITIFLYRAGLHPQHQFPKWEIRTHNYHTGKSGPSETGGVKDRVRVPPTLLGRYAEINSGRWQWHVICHIAKRPPTKAQLPQVTIDS